MISRILRKRIGFLAAGLIALATVGSALVGITEGGTWPSSWPAELEQLRPNATTYSVGTLCQEMVYEIHFQNREEFEKSWPALLSIRTPESPIRMKSVTAAKPGELWSDSNPVVRIYAPLPNGPTAKEEGKVLADLHEKMVGADEETRQEIDSQLQKLSREYLESGKTLTITPQTFDPVRSETGALPEYVTIKQGTKGWEFTPATVHENVHGFLYRARIDIELVVDGNVIDLNRIHMPENSPIIDKRLLGSSSSKSTN